MVSRQVFLAELRQTTLIFAYEPVKKGVTFHTLVVNYVVVIADFFKYGMV